MRQMLWVMSSSLASVITILTESYSRPWALWIETPLGDLEGHGRVERVVVRR